VHSDVYRLQRAQIRSDGVTIGHCAEVVSSVPEAVFSERRCDSLAHSTRLAADLGRTYISRIVVEPFLHPTTHSHHSITQ